MKTFIRLALLIVVLSSLSLAQWGTGVFVNGIELSEAQMQELAYYGIYLPSGFYWYDPTTGLFGVAGESASSGAGSQPYGSGRTDYGSVGVDGNFSGYTPSELGGIGVTCGPDGGCIYSGGE